MYNVQMFKLMSYFVGYVLKYYYIRMQDTKYVVIERKHVLGEHKRTHYTLAKKSWKYCTGAKCAAANACENTTSGRVLGKRLDHIQTGTSTYTIWRGPRSVV